MLDNLSSFMTDCVLAINLTFAAVAALPFCAFKQDQVVLFTSSSNNSRKEKE
jgi:hypothetical protein